MKLNGLNGMQAMYWNRVGNWHQMDGVYKEMEQHKLKQNKMDGWSRMEGSDYMPWNKMLWIKGTEQLEWNTVNGWSGITELELCKWKETD